jgi:hypothetical protein
MANYSEQDVMSALEQGLVTEADAEYLLSALDPSPVPAALGALGGAAVGGYAGGRLMSKGADKAAQGVDGLGPLGNRAAPKPGMNVGGMLGGGALGGAAGGMAGAAMTPEGPGLAGRATFNPATGGVGTDRDMALRMLIDPEVPAKQKRAILQQLQAMDEQMPPAEQGYGEEGGGLMSGLMGLGGMAAGGALGGTAGMKAGARMTPKMGQAAFPAQEGGNAFMNAMRGAGSAMTNPGPMAAGLGLGGAAAGGMGGAALGDMAFGQPSPYEEPF